MINVEDQRPFPRPLGDKHAKGIISRAWFSLKRISSTHSLSILAMIAYLLIFCVYSLHMSHSTLAQY